MSTSPSSIVQAVLTFVVAQVTKVTGGTPVERAVKTFVASFAAQWAILGNALSRTAIVSAAAAGGIAVYTSHVEPAVAKVKQNRAIVKAAAELQPAQVGDGNAA